MRLCKVYLCPVAVFLCLLSGIVCSDAAGSESSSPAAPSPDVLILHDSLPGRAPAGIIDGNNILDLLGHFGLKGELMPVENYREGALNRYRFVFMLSVDNRQVAYSRELLSDLRGSSIPVFWIGRHFYDLMADNSFVAKIGFRLSGPGIPTGFDTAIYKGRTLTKNDPYLFPIEILDASKVEIMETARNGAGETRPYVVHAGNLWYCADTPFGFAKEGDRYLAFCDLLHDFFKMPHQEERKALLRLEDVSIEDDPDVLMSFADYLHERHVPFQISLIPIFEDPVNGTEVYLSDRPQFVRAIRYMVSKGGLVVMHGVTHQFRGKSGFDFEFWDDLSDKPIGTDSRELVEKKLRLGLEECFKNGIYPVSWETPHYMASTLDYQTFARYFNSAYDRICSVERRLTGHFFPYPSIDRFGRFIIPESLGYIAAENPDPQAMVKNAERLQVVRDGVASFFFHPFLNRDYLAQILDGIENLGYKFISIREYDLRVQMDERLIQTYTNSIQLPLQDHYLHRFLLHDDGRVTSESYSQRRLNTTVREPGVVPPDTILVMEGVPEVSTQKEPAPPGVLQNLWKWTLQKFNRQAQSNYNLTQPEVALLWDDLLPKPDWNNQKSYASAFSAFGFRLSTLDWKTFSISSIDQGAVLVIPRAIAVKLSAKQNQSIQEFVRGGGRLVLDGPSLLSEALGIHTEKRPIKVNSVQDMLYGTQKATWDPPVDLVRFTVRSPLAIYAQDADSELPVVVLTGYENGRLLYLSTRLDPITTLGYARYPYFVHYVLKGFGMKLPLQEGQLEVYFDPGLSNRQNVDVDRLAEEWRKLGVRAVYAAAYHFWPTWSYNYEHLIDVCHKNGILVYAWFELPHVSIKFWEDHPKWRAKTATGADGLVGWRHHMDLDIPECREAAFGFVEDLLKQYAWDGVNIAELNYDSVNGPENPKSFLPMGATTRSAFKVLGGFDPILLFSATSSYYWKTNPAALQKFYNYRSQRVLAWHRSLLEQIMPLTQERDMEIIVTMLDSLHSPTLSRDTGIDSKLIVSLMDKFPFTLQVEDPSHLWADEPDRYDEFTKTYLELVPDPRRLMFDINVVPRDISNSHSPTPLLVGTELAHTIISATRASGRAGIYSEGTLPFEDLQMLSNVLAHNGKIEQRNDGWVTQSNRSVFLSTPGRWQNFRVDDILWPGWGENEVLIPGGAHHITAVEPKFSLLDTSVLDIRLVRFTGNLDELAPTDRGLQFSYDSYLRTMAIFNREPFQVIVDGQVSDEPPNSYFGLWSIGLPRGRHRVDVVADSTASIILDTTSLYSSTLIVVFGSIACGLMVLVYVTILVRRAFGRGAPRRPSLPSTQTSKTGAP